MEKLYTGHDAMDAHHVRVHLETFGIQAEVLGEMLAPGRGDLPLTQETLPAVFVNTEDLDRAREVLESYLARDHLAQAAAHPWICPECEEKIEGQFSACWQCGEPRPIED